MPDIFENNALAYEDAKRTVAEFEGTTIADDFKIRAVEHLIKTDPLAALYDALDAADLASHEPGPGFLDQLETFCKLATKVTIADDGEQTSRLVRFLVSIASDLYHTARVARPETGINPDRYRKPLERLANEIWGNELLFAHRLQDGSDYKIAFQAGEISKNGMYPIQYNYQDDSRPQDTSILINPRQTSTEARRLANAMNRCLKLTPMQVEAITTGETRNSEAA
ncbi:MULTISPECIES: hypothetical protein [Thalassospira]|uniref:Uncharacterized protein n=1 Tax=Thalassospira profundimaris TaxID=502049 RepID=A0A367V779_9PROT|nr:MULTISPECIES: hypothetical protein [Thalassospira]KZB73283.1 hypothetical protein AUQ43_18575 [Thalassospira sp. MCCC 1A01148]RCK21076.1 hypothetical protein TH6_15005 [Thalassospira profundimaris]